MNLKIFIGIAGVCVMSLAILVQGCGRAAATNEQDVSDTRQGVELTVYKQDFAMVREIRPVSVREGPQRVQVTDVSKMMDPLSILLRWINAEADAPLISAHSYDLGVEDSGALLSRFLGKEIEVVRYADNGKVAERQVGTLMVSDGGEVVLESEGKFFMRPFGTIVAPSNGDVVTIPQLTVQIDGKANKAAEMEVAYLTRGLSWSADYVATLSPNDNSMQFECWATVINQTGVDYPAAKVTLMAGQPSRAVQGSSSPYPAAMAGDYAFESNMLHSDRLRGIAPSEAVGELYAYSVGSRTTVAQGQMNRLSILRADSVEVIKDYSARLPRLYGSGDYGWGSGGAPMRVTVQLAVTFFNKVKDGLGVPLPSGAARFYEPDKTGSLRYIGAASIQDTPKEQKVYLTLANVFDAVVEAQIAKKEQVDRRTVRKNIQVVLRNEKAAAVDLRIIQEFYGRWNILSASHEYKNLDANNVEWTVNIPAGGAVTLEFAVNLGL